MGKRKEKTENKVVVVKVREDLTKLFSESEKIRVFENSTMEYYLTQQKKELRGRIKENADQKLIAKLAELNKKLTIGQLTGNLTEKEIEKLKKQIDKVESQLRKMYPKVYNMLDKLDKDIRFFKNDTNKIMKEKLFQKAIDEIDSWDIEKEFKNIIKS